MFKLRDMAVDGATGAYRANNAKITKQSQKFH